MDIARWTKTAAGNNADSPDGYPEEMSRPGINDSDRETLAAVRRWYDSPVWLDLMSNSLGAALTVSRQTDTQIKISAADMRSYFPAYRRVRLTGGATQYGYVSSSSLSGPDTIVTLVLDSGVVDPATNHVDLHLVSDLRDAVQTIIAPLAQGKHTIWIPAGALRPTAAKGCQPFTAIATAADKPDIHGVPFLDAVAATGTIVFTGLPLNNETFIINGKTLTWKTAAGGPDEITIPGTSTLCATNLAAFLEAHLDVGIDAATYTSVSTVVTITHKTIGYAGNSFTMSEAVTNMGMSGPTLSGGSDEMGAQFGALMPKSWNEGTVTAMVVGIHQGSTGTAVFELAGVCCGEGDPLSVAYGTGVQMVLTSINSGNIHKSAESAAITLAGPPAEGDVAIFRLRRLPFDGADNLATAFYVLGLAVFVTYNAATDA